MSFLTPLFLVGLAALAVPVLIHLIQRERKRVIVFPSLMFVRRIPYQSVRRRRIRNWLLLMVRLAAIALIVAAFARPFLRRPELAAAAATGAREVVILLDTSYSMGYTGRWERALAAAKDAIGRLGDADRGSVVLFSSQPEVALRSTSDQGRLLAALATAQPSAGATRYGPALKLAGSILSESPLPRREAILISDFQRAGWAGGEGVRLPERATLTPMPVGGSETTNVAVTPLLMQRSTFANQERVTLSAGVVSRGKAVANLPVALEVGGRTIQTRQVTLDANGSASFTFDPFTVSSPDMRATVRLPEDALARDNVFHAVVSPARPVRVVLVERSGAPPGGSLYVARALSIGESPRIELKVASGGAPPADLKGAGVVILNDVAASPQVAEQVGQFVRSGGGLLVVLGESASWPAARADLLPAMPAGFVNRSEGEGARIGSIEYAHPIFELFRTPRSGDFSAARFYGYRALDQKAALSPPVPAAPARETSGASSTAPPSSSSPAAAAPAIQVLARFDDGAPALVERKVGNGRVLLWTSTLDLFWNDLALKPVFLPFLHRVVRHLGAYKEPSAWLTVGQVVEAAGDSAAGSRVALTPSGRRVTLDSEDTDVLELTEQGFYEIRRQDAAKSGPVLTVASNVDLSESDLTSIDPREIVAAAAGPSGTAAASGLNAAVTPESQERMQRLWWYLLFAGVLLLGVDTLLSNRLTGPV